MCLMLICCMPCPFFSLAACEFNGKCKRFDLISLTFWNPFMSATKMFYIWICAITNSYVVFCVTRLIKNCWCSAHTIILAYSATKYCCITWQLNLAQHLISTRHLVFTRQLISIWQLFSARHTWYTQLQHRMWLSVLALKCQNYSLRLTISPFDMSDKNTYLNLIILTKWVHPLSCSIYTKVQKFVQNFVSNNIYLKIVSPAELIVPVPLSPP